MLFHGLLLIAAVVTSVWSFRSFRSGQRAVGLGAAVSAAVLGAGTLAGIARFDPWLEGGYGMVFVAMGGAYALGSSVAWRASRSTGARLATFITSFATVLISAVFFRQAVAGVEAIEITDPVLREQIINAGRGEAARLIELAVALLAPALFMTASPFPPAGRKVVTGVTDRSSAAPRSFPLPDPLPAGRGRLT